MTNSNEGWVSVDEKLPNDKQRVLCYMGNYRQAVKYDVCQFIKGVVIENDVAGQIIRSEDQHGNNKKPYCWDTFGSMRYFGQDCTHWMPLPEPPNQIP